MDLREPRVRQRTRVQPLNRKRKTRDRLTTAYLTARISYLLALCLRLVVELIHAVGGP